MRSLAPSGETLARAKRAGAPVSCPLTLPNSAMAAFPAALKRRRVGQILPSRSQKPPGRNRRILEQGSSRRRASLPGKARPTKRPEPHRNEAWKHRRGEHLRAEQLRRRNRRRGSCIRAPRKTPEDAATRGRTRLLGCRDSQPCALQASPRNTTHPIHCRSSMHHRCGRNNRRAKAQVRDGRCSGERRSP